MGQRSKAMKILNMGDTVSKQGQLLEFLAGDKAIYTVDEVRAEVKADKVKKISKTDHTGDLILGEIQGR